jgi:probable phosphoglycerate mutase
MVHSIRELFIFRHGETDWNAEGRFQGHIDIPLNDVGRVQARALALTLQSEGLEAVLSSDLSRAHETARIVGAALGVPVFTDEKLRESHLGEAQGMTYGDIVAKFGDHVMGKWRSDLPTDADVAYPGGETGNQVMGRVFSSMEHFLDREPYGKVGVSCHGGVIRRIMQRLRPPGSEPVHIPNTVLYRIRFDARARTWHLG